MEGVPAAPRLDALWSNVRREAVRMLETRWWDTRRRIVDIVRAASTNAARNASQTCALPHPISDCMVRARTVSTYAQAAYDFESLV